MRLLVRRILYYIFLHQKANFDVFLHNHLIFKFLYRIMCYPLRNLLRYLLRFFLDPFFPELKAIIQFF